MIYQVIHELEVQHRIRELEREAEQRARVSQSSYEDFAQRKIRQLQQFAGAIVLFTIALAAGSTAMVLDEVGSWVYWVLAVWAVILVSRAIKLFAPMTEAKA
jgi:hypothetical protein